MGGPAGFIRTRQSGRSRAGRRQLTVAADIACSTFIDPLTSRDF